MARPVSRLKAGNSGRMYGVSFDCDTLKNSSTNAAHINSSELARSPPRAARNARSSAPGSSVVQGRKPSASTGRKNQGGW